MVTAGRVLDLERLVVCSMERDLRLMLNQKQHKSELLEKTAAVSQRHHEIEARKRHEQAILMEDHAAKAAKQAERKERVQANLERDRLLMAAAEESRQVQALQKQEHIAAEREAVVARQRAEGEAKREYIQKVKEQLDQLQEAKQHEYWHSVERHEKQCQRASVQKQVALEKCARRRVLKEKETAERREASKIQQEQLKQVTEERLSKKDLFLIKLRQKKEADMKSITKIKEEFAAKKHNLREILEKAEKTGDLQKVTDELVKLKEHHSELEARAHQEWAENTAMGRSASSSPMRRPGRSGVTPLRTTPVTPRQQRVLAETPLPFSQRAWSPENVQTKLSIEDKDVPAAGTHYAHLMGVFKKHNGSPKKPRSSQAQTSVGSI